MFRRDFLATIGALALVGVRAKRKVSGPPPLAITADTGKRQEALERAKRAVQSVELSVCGQVCSVRQTEAFFWYLADEHVERTGCDAIFGRLYGDGLHVTWHGAVVMTATITVTNGQRIPVI